MNPAQVNSSVSQAQAQGGALQQQYNNQAGQTYQQYQDSYNNAQQQQANLQNYTSQIAGLNYGDIFGQRQQQQEQQLGYNPQTTQNAAQGLTTAENIMAALPQAVNQMGNYSGATAGQVAQNYQNMGSGINQQLTNANNAMQNQLGMYSAAANTANQQTSQQLTGQGQVLSGYQAGAQNAQQIMASAGQTMNQIETLQQQQGYMTAQQVAAYQNAYSQYITAQAAQSSAAAAGLQAQASMIGAQATSGLYGAQTAQINQGLNAGSGNKSIAQLLSGNAGTGGLNVSTGSGLQGY